MPFNSRLGRRGFLLGATSALAAPALAQTKGVFDELGANADPKDLIDQIWDPEAQKYITIRDLIDRLVDAPIILVGERHGFAPHQNREAFLLKALADRGRYPTLALEMLQPRHDKIIRRYRARNPEYARRLGIALDWANSGWPDWSYYEPIFDAAFAAKLPIIGADLPMDEQRRIEREGTPERPDDPAIIESWKASLEKVYCGLKSEDEIEREALKQWKRDVHMADRITDNSVLLSGIEHMRAERGVSNYLTQDHVPVRLDAKLARKEHEFVWITRRQRDSRRLC